MSEKEVKVEGLTADNATLLLAAAAELDYPVAVVKTTSFGWFEVPEAVAKKAGLKAMVEESDEKPAAAAKKAAAPKSKE